ncbi:MAG TPA: FAD-dependent oxidoreductase [Paludibaculum sp.]
MSAAPDVAIVGGGIVGAACALECSRAGLSVEVYEQSIVGGGATASGMGHVVVMDDSEAQFALTHYSSSLWRELAADLPAAAEYLPCGTLWVAADDEEMAEVHRKQAFYQARGVNVEVLDARQVAKAEPHLRPGFAGGLLVPGDCVVYPPVVAQWLLDQAGVTIHHQQVRALADVPAGIVVNAMGAKSARLSPGIPVAPRKGHLVITDRHPGFVRHQLIELGYLKSAHSASGDSVAFNVQPRKTGQVLIGSSRQYGAEHKEIDREILTRMLRRAAEYMPGIGALTAIRTWTGFRASTPDKLPLIGPWHGREWLATGHEGLGISTSLGTGRLLADLITGRTPPIPAEPYLPARCRP